MQKEELRVWGEDTQDNTELVWWDEEQGWFVRELPEPSSEASGPLWRRRYH